MGVPHDNCIPGDCEWCDVLWLLEHEVIGRDQRVHMEGILRGIDEAAADEAIAKLAGSADALFAKLEGEEEAR